MNMRTWQVGWAAVVAAMAGGRAEGKDSGPEVAPLPPGVRAVWNLESAERERTPTRERVCLNGLWRWQPAGDGSADAEEVPAQGWGHFKVPGAWPGITDYMQKDAQSVFAHASWQARRLRDVTVAWYQREFTLPADWSGRRIVLAAEYVNSVAGVWLDGRRIGEIRFPGGELDLTAACRPGATHVLSLRVAALPLKEVLLSYADTNTAREVRARVARRGLCGDVHLLATPAGARIEDVKVETSWRRREVTFEVELAAVPPDVGQVVEVVVSRDGQTERTFRSAAFRDADPGRRRFRGPVRVP
ncbi:MAG: hypothetical protein HZC55_16565 [Verrucomicrobia bacterium]|nr:hypothetical protein [Verrucomicrobiota bacterium]